MSSCSLASAISSFFSTVSLVSWICAQMPQIYTNYTTKSAEGISPLFLLLWFMGDFLSFTSCLLNDVVLPFQVYLSLFFICNDLALCYQYYYYNSVYPRKHMHKLASGGPVDDIDAHGVSHIADVHSQANAIHIRPKAGEVSESMSLSPSEESASSSFGSIGQTKRPGVTKVAAVSAFVHSGVANAMAISQDTEHSNFISTQAVGLFLAWCCTAVYVSSRLPQLYKNYKRKSVDGISPLLFGSALMGNLTYTISILTSCEFLLDSNKTAFFWRQLPYILGSSGTVVFDVAYFYQRYIYRNAGRNSSEMGLQPWDSNESRPEEW